MPAKIMDGTRLAQSMLAETMAGAQRFVDRTGRKPVLATVLVGIDPASHTYVRMKRNRCRRVGIDSRSTELPDRTTTDELVARIGELSADPSVHGILLQHPVPGHIDERTAFEAIAPAKDVDGVTMHSFDAMASASPASIPALREASSA